MAEATLSPPTAGKPTYLLAQPMLGVAGAAIVIVLSLSLAVALPPPTINGWVGLVLTATVPTLIVQTVVWRGRVPVPRVFAQQPGRGTAGLAVMAAFGATVAAIAIWVCGGGQTEPTPFVMMPLVSTVPITLWQVFLFNCWPFSRWAKSPIAIGLLVLAASYGGAAVADHLLFDYGFLQGVPFYEARLDPRGAFDARDAVAILVASAGGVLALAALDFWPVTTLARALPILEKQPWRGAASLALVLCVAVGLWTLCVAWRGMDVAAFQARVCVSFIFGMFILLVMLEGKAFAGWPQPVQGLLVNGTAALIAVAAYALYHLAATRLCDLVDLSPSRDLETWISTAMLAITFPSMGVFADLFEFWPLRWRR
jgi:hypothetical protein